MKKMMTMLVLAMLATGAVYACDGDGKTAKKKCCSTTKGTTAKNKKPACCTKTGKTSTTSTPAPKKA